MNNTTVRESRREERRPGDGSVRIKYANPRPVEIDGKLVDVSAGGFRMKHKWTALSAGQIVEFSHTDATGQARVVWNRVAGNHVETGFLLVGTGK
jgi:hypothetical protein